MLEITIPASEFYDEAKREFINTKAQTLQLEHSLLSLSKWESKWHKPFLSKEDKTDEETLDYIRCMTITRNVDPYVYTAMTPDIIREVNAYLENPMTATWFNDKRGNKPNREVITAEIIYYWMISLDIPFECEKWHLNRLLALVKVCDIKNAPSKKMSKNDIYKQNRSLNAARKAKLGTRG